jgi:hypothetical protein
MGQLRARKDVEHEAPAESEGNIIVITLRFY